MNKNAKTWTGSAGGSTILNFKMSTWNGSQGIEKLILKFKNFVDVDSVEISIQHPGRMFAPEIIDSTFSIKRDMRTVVTARYSVIFMMNKLTYPCVPIEDDEKYHFDDCQQDFVYEKLVTELGCGVPWMSQFTKENASHKVCEIRLSAKASDLYDMSMKLATCRQPCCTMEVDMTNKFTTDTKNDTSLEIRFPPTIKEYKEIEIYALYNMLAELGGYLGMFLGVSFLDLRILVDYLPGSLGKKK